MLSGEARKDKQSCILSKGIITDYSYIRDPTTEKPIITICDLKYDGVCYRGISLCSEMDAPLKVRGRGIAYSRALNAAINECDTLPINRKEATILFNKTRIEQKPLFKSMVVGNNSESFLKKP